MSHASRRTSAVPAAAEAATRNIRTPTLVTLALLSSVAPFGTDLYLASFPAMVSELSTTSAWVQLSLTTFLVGAGLGQLIFGPLSDRFGRRGPLIGGLVVYVASSIIAVIAPSIGVLVAARLIQGITGSAGMVIGRAVILDRARGQEAAAAMNLMMLIGGVAPVAAPLAGSMLADHIGWRGLLGIVAALGILSLALTFAFVPESHPATVRAAQRSHRSERQLRNVLTRSYLGYTFAFAFGMGGFFAYISASPFIYQNLMGLSAPQYGIAFAINAVALAACSAVSAKLTARFSTSTLTGIGLLVELAAGLAVLGLSLGGAPARWLMIPLFLGVAALGLVFGNATALALETVPAASMGLGSAILGMLQFALAGIVAALAGLGGESSATPVGLLMSLSSAVAVASLLWALGARRTRILG